MARPRTFGRNGRWVGTGETPEEGGQAHIHVVTDSTGQRSGEYVLKLLKNTKRTPRLDREIETTRRLYTEGCPVLEIVDDYLTSDPNADRPWYVAPRVTLGALTKHLRSGEHYGGSFESAMQLYRGVVDGVLSIHAKKVAHRDLKPGNILLEPGKIVLADLGLALALGEVEGERLTTELERIGSLHYTPPEAFSRRPVDPQQFAFDAYALGKILYEVLAGASLPAFIQPTDHEYDLTAKWNAPSYRATNRVLRGLLHDDPSVRLTYLAELPGQIDELVALHVTRESLATATPRWHTDLLSASDLLASTITASTPKSRPDVMKGEADQIAQEILDVWQSSDAVARLDAALGTARGGHLAVTRPTLLDAVRTQLGGFQPTRRGLEPLEDAGYPFRPDAESGAHISVASAVAGAVPFRQLWLCALVGVKEDAVAAVTCIMRREEGVRGTVDLVRDRLRINIARTGEPGLVGKVRHDAEELLATYVLDVIEEVKRATKK